jgi:hypothetical protein
MKKGILLYILLGIVVVFFGIATYAKFRDKIFHKDIDPSNGTVINNKPTDNDSSNPTDGLSDKTASEKPEENQILNNDGKVEDGKPTDTSPNVMTDNPPSNEDTNSTVTPAKQSKVDLNSQKAYNLGKEIYDKKEYTKYKKDESGVYVITYGDLKKAGYSLSFLGEDCLDESVIIKIDADFKLKSTYYDDYPVMFIPACMTQAQKEEIEELNKRPRDYIE